VFNTIQIVTAWEATCCGMRAAKSGSWRRVLIKMMQYVEAPFRSKRLQHGVLLHGA